MSNGTTGVRFVCDCGRAYDPEKDSHEIIHQNVNVTFTLMGIINMHRTAENVRSLQWTCGACACVQVKPYPDALATAMEALQINLNIGGDIVKRDKIVYNEPQKVESAMSAPSNFMSGDDPSDDDDLVGRHKITVKMTQRPKCAYRDTFSVSSRDACKMHGKPGFIFADGVCKMCGYLATD